MRDKLFIVTIMYEHETGRQVHAGNNKSIKSRAVVDIEGRLYTSVDRAADAPTVEDGYTVVRPGIPLWRLDFYSC